MPSSTEMKQHPIHIESYLEGANTTAITAKAKKSTHVARIARRPPTGRFFRVQASDVRVALGFARRIQEGEGDQDAATAAAADADATAITTTSTAADGCRRHRRRRW